MDHLLIETGRLAPAGPTVNPAAATALERRCNRPGTPLQRLGRAAEIESGKQLAASIASHG